MKQDSTYETWSAWLIPVALIVGLVLLLSVPSQTAVSEAARSPLDDWLKVLVGYLASGAEIAAGLVIGVGIIRSLVDYIRQVVVRSQSHLDASEIVRLKLGRILALGLEFTVASDILRTAVAPTRQDILNLGAIVLLRSLLNYFLEREIRQGEERGSGQETARDVHP